MPNSPLSRREVLRFLGASMTLPAFSQAAFPASGEPFPVAIHIDAEAALGELAPIWRFFGCDEPNYSYHDNGKKLLEELGKLRPNHVYFRTHNLLTTGDGTPALKWGSTNAYTEDAQGQPVYDWTITDRIFEAGLKRGVKPYVQIGFMPEALSVHPLPYRHHWTPHAKYEEIYTGWAYPPKDYSKWGELAYQWAKHCAEKYGRAEVETWYWEVWNEPNIGYWQGTREDYFKLYDFAVDGVRRALPTARVGGPETAGGPGGTFLPDFLEHCLRGTNHATGAAGAPLDFISFHAKGAPEFSEGHVRMGISQELNDIDAAFAVVAGFPEFKRLPLIIGEADPDGCAACQGPQLGYRNGPLYASYTAASFARMHELAARHGVNMEGALTWAFEFEDQPLFAGFRQIASGGFDLSVLNVFRMLSRMHGQRLSVQSSSGLSLAEMQKNGVRAAPDVSAMAAFDGAALSVLVWHYHDDGVPGADAAVEIALRGLPAAWNRKTLTHFRIDDTHSNAFAAWQQRGAPPQPNEAQAKQMEEAGRLALLSPPEAVTAKNGTLHLRFPLPRQGVSLLVIK